MYPAKYLNILSKRSFCKRILPLSDISSRNVFPNCRVYAFLNYPSLLRGHVLYRLRSRLLIGGQAAEFARPILAYEITGVSRVLPAEEEFRLFERLRGNRSCSFDSDGNKIVREEADSSAAERGKEESASSLPDPAFARSFLRLLLAAPAAVLLALAATG